MGGNKKAWEAKEIEGGELKGEGGNIDRIIIIIKIIRITWNMTKWVEGDRWW